MKQTIEIEVPNGKKAVWNNGKIEFIDVDVIELLKNSKNPEDDLMSMIRKEVDERDDDNLLDLYNKYDEYAYSPAGTHIELIAKLKLFLAYLNKGHKFDLISGDVYFPYVRFYRKDKLPGGETVVSYFEYKENVYALVSGRVYNSFDTGLAFFGPNYGFGNFVSSCGFLACRDKETAQFVATTFAKLLFDVNFGSLIDYEWLN